jgi:hypothetical protein
MREKKKKNFLLTFSSYEQSESDVMKRRPRNVKTDRLVTLKLVIYAYFYLNIFQVKKKKKFNLFFLKKKKKIGLFCIFELFCGVC